VSYTFSIPGHEEPISMDIGQTLFVLGANGTGKSALLQRIVGSGGDNVRRISASRQLWMQSSGVSLSPSQKLEWERNTVNWDRNSQSRWQEQNAQMRASLALFDLVDAENREAREVRAAVRAGNIEAAQLQALKSAPLERINELLLNSNIPIAISVQEHGQVVARKNGGPTYGVAELSDGERNALLIGANVLTAKPGTLLVIDEPERHLHRSIISPLLSQLMLSRDDCAFVVATHDVMLPVDNPSCQVLLVRSCTFSGQTPSSWDVDLLPREADVSEELKRDILGARRNIVFVEGQDDSSLDRPLYNLLFPSVSIRAKGPSRDVMEALRGVRSSESMHWVKAWAIIDNDGRDASEIAELEDEGIFVIPFYSVESIYFHPQVIAAVAKRQVEAHGGYAEANVARAISKALRVVEPRVDHLAVSAVEKSIRRMVFEGLPTSRSLQEKKPVNISIDTADVIEAEADRLQEAVANGDWLYVVRRCPIRKTPALDAICEEVGLRTRAQYENAVLQMLRHEPSMLALVRSFFGGLPAKVL
jgi:ABC-type Mn2+/Zn2+ transport system ATPase subunit